MPASASGGNSLTAGTRCAVVTPSARIFPLWINGNAGGTSQNIIWIWPPTRSLSAGAELRRSP